VAVWCWLYWLLSFNTGSYLELLSEYATNAAATNTTEDAKAAFDSAQVIYHDRIKITAVLVVFSAIVYALTLVIGGILAALWRRGIYDQLFALQFPSEPQMVIVAYKS
jgi:ABC-type dipeptide/oligopeptide/nickel transport system permease component